eukprot:scaffold40868_cov15-Tisochrysis_lutea.AAC.1
MALKKALPESGPENTSIFLLGNWSISAGLTPSITPPAKDTEGDAKSKMHCHLSSDCDISWSNPTPCPDVHPTLLLVSNCDISWSNLTPCPDIEPHLVSGRNPCACAGWALVLYNHRCLHLQGCPWPQG